jgi:excinuclease ABC subunit C
MREVLTRRFKRLLDGDEKFTAPPDLLLADGGAVHAKMMRDALRTLGLDIPVFGMVKDSRHRTRALQSPEGAEIGLSANPALFALIGQIQEETHRFAVTFHQKRREQAQNQSELDKIPGVGKARRAALLKRFKSVKNIKAAGVEELGEVVPASCAAAIRRYFEEEQNASNRDTAPV